jgi:hypothetical protein
MSKKIIWALIVLAVCIVIFIFNRRDLEVNLLVTTVKTTGGLVLFVFTGLGILVGLLLK